MDIELSDVGEEPEGFAGDVRLDAKEGDRRSLDAHGIRFPGPFHVAGHVHRTPRHVVIDGHVDGEAQLECGRCLGPVPHRVSLDFRARFTTEVPAERPGAEEDGEGIAVDREELDVSFLTPGATSLSVDEVVREQVLLDVPVRPLCSEGCPGLCPRCGADLNEGPCPCPAAGAVTDPRLAPLLELKRRLKSR